MAFSMKFVIAVLFTILCFSSILVLSKKTKTRSDKKSTTSKTNEVDGDDKFNNLLNSFKHKAVVPLSDKNFSKYITSRPRKYYAAVMMTALGEQYQCQICQLTAVAWKQVAEYYQGQYDLGSSDLKERLAFFVVDVEYSRQVNYYLRL